MLLCGLRQQRRGVFTCMSSISATNDVDFLGRLRPVGLARQFDNALWAWPLAFNLLWNDIKKPMMIAQRIKICVPEAKEAQAGFPLISKDVRKPSRPEEELARITTWISGIGETTVTMASALVSHEGVTIATGSRDFVMIDANFGSRAAWSDEERASIVEAMEVGKASVLPEVEPTERLSNRAREIDTRVEDSQWSSSTTRIVRQRIMPHHVNVAEHACHAHLLEFLHSSHLIRTSSGTLTDDVSINYYGEAGIGDDIEAISAPDPTVIAIRLLTGPAEVAGSIIAFAKILPIPSFWDTAYSRFAHG